jgi:death-on-curing protein
VSEPVWITDREAVALNHRLIALFGGLGGGARDENLLQAALARPLNKWHYDDPRPDLFALAAAYVFAIARGQVFIDGNKRTGHAVAAVFSRQQWHRSCPGRGRGRCGHDRAGRGLSVRGGDGRLVPADVAPLAVTAPRDEPGGA